MNEERPVKPHAKTMDQLLDKLVVAVVRRQQTGTDSDFWAEQDAFLACLHQVSYLVNRLHYECTVIDSDAGVILRDWDRPEDHEAQHAKCEVSQKVRRILWDFENTVVEDE